jgi:hypothetical protein
LREEVLRSYLPLQHWVRERGRAGMAEIGAPDARSSVDQIVRELAADFDGMPVDAIEQLVLGSLGELSEGARIGTYLPLLTKRVARERLRRQTSAA